MRHKNASQITITISLKESVENNDVLVGKSNKKGRGRLKRGVKRCIKAEKRREIKKNDERCLLKAKG